MIAVQFLSRDELEKKLAPYKCRFIAEFYAGQELWETGWGYPFTMTNEGGRYDFWQYQRVLAYVIAKSMPPLWHEQNGSS